MASRASTVAGKRRASARSARAAPAGRKPAKRGTSNAGRGGHTNGKRPAAAGRSAPARAARSKRAPAKRASAPARRPRRTARRRAKAKRASLGRRFVSLLPRARPRTVLVGLPLLVAALAAGYLGWFRDSSLVAVEDVEVTGVGTADNERITAALSETARGMTTLHFDEQQLEASVKAFPTVGSVSADTSFPNGVAIEVTERPPALIATAAGESVAVAGDGTLLRGLDVGDAGRRLPEIAVAELPRVGRFTGEPLARAEVAGAAPAPLRPLIEKISYAGERGLEVVMKGGIPIRFGSPAAAAEKWAAAAAVLADRHLKTLTYVDVRAPDRPAVGGTGAPSEEATDPAVDAVAPDPATTPATTTPVAPETAPVTP